VSDFNLPEGWVETPLGEYLYLKNGYAFKSNSYVAKSDDTVPVIRISDIDGKIAHDEAAIHVKKADVVDGFEIKNGDLLIAMSGATTGKVGVYKGSEPAYQNQRVGNLKLHSNEHGSPKYKNHLIASLTPDILKIAYGGAQPNISGKAIEELLVALPPLAEQKQIAQKLDELLAQVDTLKTRLEAIPKILKRFRQSVLAAAVSGRLTAEWRGSSSSKIQKIELNDLESFWVDKYKAQNRKFKLPNIASPEFEIQDLPDSWLGTQLGYVFDVYVGATPSRTDQRFWGGSVSWVSSSEVAFCRIKSTKEKITEHGLSAASTHVHPKGTVMLAMIGQGKTRGQVAILDIEACHNQNTAALRIPNKFALSEYLYFYLSKQYEETRRVGGGNNQQALNKATVQSLNFPLPPLEEQTEIVRRVEQLFAYADQIELRVRDAQARVKHLTQSILAKAFRGELTAEWRAQNPELISGENSAAALLEWIKAERNLVTSKKKPKR
jgi:type I restriction enzyme S subunit